VRILPDDVTEIYKYATEYIVSQVCQSNLLCTQFVQGNNFVKFRTFYGPPGIFYILHWAYI